MILNGALVQEYYARIDAGDVGWVIDLFTPDAVYQRAGTRFAGRDALHRFFAEDRRISGVHRIEALWSLGDKVICVGLFEGEGAQHDARSVRFSDFWFFNEKSLVVERQTYLARGFEYVQ